MRRPQRPAAFLRAALLIVAAACAPSRGGSPEGAPAPAPSPAPATRPAPAPDATSWAFRYAPGTRRYRVTSEATVELRDDSARRQAPIRTSASVTLSFTPAPGDDLALAATVDDYSVDRGDAIPAPDSSLPSRATLRATLAPTGQLDAAPAPLGCDPADALTAIARELVVPLPDTLAVGDRWSDSASTTACRGGVPVTTGIVRDYEVERREMVRGAPVLHVRRRERFTLAGASSAPGRTTVITGRGTGTTLLRIDPAAGALLDSSGESEADLTVRAGRLESRFHQRVRTTAKAQ